MTRTGRWYHVLYITYLFALLWNCSSEEQTGDMAVIAKIDDRIITTREFIQRAEYTIRPPWCATGQYIHRKIVLNSLIAEKLVALDFPKADSLLSANPAVENYLQGRKEQEMRQLHFQKNASDKVELTDAKVAELMRSAERTFDVEVISLHDDRLASALQKDISTERVGFDDLLQELEATGQKIRPMALSFDSPMEDPMFKALFIDDVEKGEVLGPLRIDKDYHVLLRVNGWTRRPVMSESALQQKRLDVRDKLKEVEARDIHEQHLIDLMSGKQLQLNAPVFKLVVEATGQDYYQSKEERKQAFRDRFWNTGDSDKKVIDDITEALDEIKDETLFSVDGQDWTVAEFEEYLQIHPLVFRKKKIPKAAFAEQMKNAIADLVRDYYITEEAYEKGYDEHPEVRRRTRMWQDNLIALHQRNVWLSEINTADMDQEKIVDRFIESKIDQLRKKYTDKVFINTDEFENTKLSNIDMFVIQDNVPFPVVVPQFPVLTRHDDLDYGQKLTEE